MMSIDYVWRLVVTDIESGYVVSLSRLSGEGEVEIIAEEEVQTISAAHQILVKASERYLFSIDRVERLYNIDGKMTITAPRSRE